MHYYIGGGSDSATIMFTSWPYEIRTLNYVREYTMVQLGVHMHSLIIHVIENYKLKNFQEILLHHFYTVILI